ncbi:MAG: PKD domain-containing protein [Armatimonadetes bacterium]|nr:PKD domain-containing protein [Armatimonadota bacterium]MBX3108287.1 PKD domain-containing protein [Fimbriimonadaceae bacterium]
MKLMTKMMGLACLVAFGALAQAQTVYDPTRTAADQGLKLVGWGSGSVAEDDSVAYDGGTSIRISSRNFFQGGKIMLLKPFDMSGLFENKDNLLRFMLNIPNQGSPTTGGSNRGGRGGGGLAGAGTAGGGGGGAGVEGGIGGAPGGAGGPQATDQSKPVSKIRVVFTTTDGKHGEVYLDVSTSLKDERGWFSVGVPLQAINGLANTNKVLASISVSLDSVATVYLGQASIFRDSTPVFADPNVRELNLGYGDEFTFTASGSAGATPVKFLWDFDSSDGISVDAEGPSVKRRFRTAGTFTVTLTAVDIYGLKQPYKTTIQVTVNP